MKRQVDYAWRLAEIMAAHGIHNSTDLIPRLANTASNSPALRSIASFTNAANASRCS